MMRILYAVMLVVLLAFVGIFAFQNQEPVTLSFLEQSRVWPLAAVVGLVYLLGMMSGWTVIGFVSRSWRRVTEQSQS